MHDYYSYDPMIGAYNPTSGFELHDSLENARLRAESILHEIQSLLNKAGEKYPLIGDVSYGRISELGCAKPVGDGVYAIKEH